MLLLVVAVFAGVVCGRCKVGAQRTGQGDGAAGRKGAQTLYPCGGSQTSSALNFILSNSSFFFVVFFFLFHFFFDNFNELD